MLVVGEKIYALNTDDKAVLAMLNQQAGKNATVTGTVNGVGSRCEFGGACQVEVA